jgi:hypothetical protein
VRPLVITLHWTSSSRFSPPSPLPCYAILPLMGQGEVLICVRKKRSKVANRG